MITPNFTGFFGAAAAPWEGNLHVAMGDGNPSLFATTTGNLSVKASDITNSKGRLVRFRYKTAITIAKLRWGTYSTVSTAAFRFAIYNANTGARVWTGNTPAFSTLSAWHWMELAPASPIEIAADTAYWFGVSVQQASPATTSYLTTFPTPLAPWQLATQPGSIAGYTNHVAQVTLTSPGVWPDPLPTLANAAWAVGTAAGVPIVFFDRL